MTAASVIKSIYDEHPVLKILTTVIGIAIVWIFTELIDHGKDISAIKRDGLARDRRLDEIRQDVREMKLTTDKIWNTIKP